MTQDIFVRLLKNPEAILVVILFFGASIFLHELGHYLAARWRGLKIERFSIGFGPKLFGWTDKRGVDWRISLFPLGGYVALPQLADMRGIEGAAQSGEDLPRISYADKMYVSVAGALFNVIFALAIGTVLWITGLPSYESQETTQIGYIAEQVLDEDGNEREGPAFRAGLQPGDTILSIDGEKVEDFEDIVYGITTGTGRSEYGNPKSTIRVDRDGTEVTFTVFPVLGENEGMRQIGIGPASSLIIGEALENSPADLAGLQPQDQIITVNQIPMFSRSALSLYVNENPDTPLALGILRDDRMIEATLLPENVVYNQAGDTVPMIGVRWHFQSTLKHENPFTQITNAFKVTIQVLGALLHPKSDIGISNLSGPVGISYTLYLVSQIGLLEVLSIVVLININLAILNLLPIPVLDGGHMAFATIGKLRGRPLPPNLIMSAQSIFMLLFLFIFVYVTFFDFGRVGRNEAAIQEEIDASKQRVPIVFKGAQEDVEAQDSDPQTPTPAP